MTWTQWGILVAAVGSLGGMIASLPDWKAAATPAFIGAALVSISATVGGILSKGPQK